MAKKKTTGARIEIRPAKIKGKPTGFRVVVIGKNGEVLSTSEVLTTPANVVKNIASQNQVLVWAYNQYNWLPELPIEGKPVLCDVTGKVFDPDGSPITKKK